MLSNVLPRPREDASGTVGVRERRPPARATGHRLFRRASVLGAGFLLAAAPAALGGQELDPATALPTSGASAEGEVGDALSLEEALDLAHRNNPDYRIQQSDQRTADLRVREAYGNLLPSANISNTMGFQASGERRFGDVRLGEQPAMLSSSYNFGLSLSLSGTSLLRPRVARAQARATEARIEGASVGLVEEVTAAYLDALEADAELGRARAQLERSRSQVRQAEAQREVGAATALDVRRAQVQEGQAEVAVLQAENQVVTTRLALGRVVGVDLSRDIDLTSDFELIAPDLDVEELVAVAMDANPVLRASRAEEEAAETEVQAARSEWLPTLSLSAGVRGQVVQASDLDPLVQNQLRGMQDRYDSCVRDNQIRDLLGDPLRDCQQFDPTRSEVESDIRAQLRQDNRGFPFGFDSQPWDVSLTISFPLFTGFSRELQREEARTARSNVREQIRGEELRLRSEVEAAVRAVETARRTVALQGRVRETAADELELAQERFRLGMAGSIEVVDAQANLSDAEREEIAALYEFHRALASLEGLVGRSLR